MQRKHLTTAVVAGLGLAGAIAYAANRGPVVSIVPVATHEAPASPRNPGMSGPAAVSDNFARIAAKPAPPPTDAEVGDAASYARNVRWLGAASGFVAVASTAQCAAWAATDPGISCRPIADAEAVTPFADRDIARIALPAGASNSMLCHMADPQVEVVFRNSNSDLRISKLRYNIVLKMENPVLADPSLIDPGTGAPMNGALQISLGMDSANQAMPANTVLLEHEQSAKVCGLDNLISKRTLVEVYGLSQAQANRFFTSPTTIRLGVSGSVQRVDYAKLWVNLRLTGD